VTSKPTDAQILAAITERPSGAMTYYIRNVLSETSEMRGLKTTAVLSRLKRMELAGVVVRTSAAHDVHCWWTVAVPVS
jgi:DNA-binding MarR family transcriptional regulator